MTDATPARIGVVLVHGVGEQRRFDHLSGEVRNLVAALSAQQGATVTVETRKTQDSEVGAEHESWRADRSAPVKIHVAAGATRVCLCVHEVWWADLDDKETLWNRFKFWLWGLGFWGVKKFGASSLPGASSMQPPAFPVFPGGDVVREAVVRVRLWLFANVFIMSALTVNLLNSVLSGLRLGQIPGVEVFYQYVGDVKLYQDRGRRGAGPLTDPDDPRRVAIRRRMVEVLVDAYRADYERWYVLAHSLGTVVAWNGLMETEHCLPNYLSQETHASLAGDLVLARRAGLAVGQMRPARPVWITDDQEVLDRRILFARLRGLVTYGSPLDKFAYLWRAIVPLNKDTSVWNPAFEWINVYEHTDPVSSKLTAFSGLPGSPPPANHAYKASPILLLSHLKYLSFKKSRGADQFVVRLLGWIFGPASKFPAPLPADKSWYRRTNPAFGLMRRLPMWIAGGAVFALLLAWLGVPALLEMLAWISSKGFLEGTAVAAWSATLAGDFAALSIPQRFVGVLEASAVFVTIAGFARRILEHWL